MGVVNDQIFMPKIIKNFEDSYHPFSGRDCGDFIGVEMLITDFDNFLLLLFYLIFYRAEALFQYVHH